MTEIEIMQDLFNTLGIHGSVYGPVNIADFMAGAQDGLFVQRLSTGEICEPTQASGSDGARAIAPLGSGYVLASVDGSGRSSVILAERAADDGTKFRDHRRDGIRIADHGHHARRMRDGVIERHDAQYRLEDGGRGDAVERDQPARAGCRRKIGVDHDDLVAMPHGGEGMQQIRRKQRVESDEHGRRLLCVGRCHRTHGGGNRDCASGG